jgi:hypothetical protein
MLIFKQTIVKINGPHFRGNRKKHKSPIFVLYIDYHSVCPIFRIGTPHPLSRKRLCYPPPRTKGGWTFSPAGEGGSQFGQLEKKPSTLSTLWKRHLHFNPIQTKPHTVLFFFVKKYTFLRRGRRKGVKLEEPSMIFLLI